MLHAARMGSTQVSTMREQHRTRGKRDGVVAESDTVPIRSQYTQRIAADLDANRQEQEQLTARLAQLQEDEAWLVGLLSASREESASGDTDDTGPTVPQQRETAPAAPATAPRGTAGGKKKAAKSVKAAKPAASAKSAASPKDAKDAKDTRDSKPAKSPKPAKKAATTAKAAQPSLRTLVQEALLGHPGEPRSAGEVLAELEAAHPERNASPQAVRNALEFLIASGAATRERQGRSVFYVLKPDADIPAAQAPQEDTAVDA
jgi:hypothetical protein